NNDLSANQTSAAVVAQANTALTATSCQSVSAMTSIAKSYTSNSMFLTTTDLNGICPGRGKPRYLGNTAGYFPSVPYDWGGYDSVSSFNNFMSAGYQAGDIDSNTIESCSKGVDCSGFVSNVWASGRYTTSTVSSISLPVTQSQLQTGDIIIY